MKITKNQLKTIISEELRRMLKEIYVTDTEGDVDVRSGQPRAEEAAIYDYGGREEWLAFEEEFDSALNQTNPRNAIQYKINKAEFVSKKGEPRVETAPAGATSAPGPSEAWERIGRDHFSRLDAMKAYAWALHPRGTDEDHSEKRAIVNKLDKSFPLP